MCSFTRSRLPIKCERRPCRHSVTTHTIDAIRARFRLPEERPLLAFSLKPRVGLSFDETRKITIDVLRAGFNIVELDSRNLALSSAPLDQWIDLGKEAA